MPTGIYQRKLTGSMIYCKVCHKEFYVGKYRLNKGQGKFCSFKCFSQSYEYKIQRLEKMKTCRIGKTHTEETKTRIKNSCKGQKRTMATRIKMSKAMSGNKSPRWKGGISKEYYILRHSLKFKLWRESVFKRDNYTCQDCGERGGVLHPHHIKEFSKFPKLRFELSNGKTLCKDCHFKIHFKTWKK